MFWEAISAARDLGRLHEIATVLIRYGFGDMVRRLGMSGVLERAGRVLHWKDVHAMATLTPPERTARMMEELGPTFVKLGQLLSTRVDLFPSDWISAFEKLQDQVPAVPFELLREQLVADLGRAPEEIFARFETEAFAAASMAQVHRAWLEDGTAVVLKIRRPGITETIEADLRLLARLAEIAEGGIPELKPYCPIDVARQFSLSLRRELDLEGECRHAERIAANLVEYPYIVIPRVYWQWTSQRLNVQEYMDGIHGRDLAALDAAGLDRGLLAQRGTRAVLKMVLVDGFFHADPHLGNVICLADNRLAFIDFGMVGRLSTARRDQLTDLVYALMTKDAIGVVDSVLIWVGDRPVNEEALVIEVDAFLDHYHGRTLKDLDFSALLSDLAAIIREHQLVLPADLALLFKTLISLDGVGRRLDPQFNIVSEVTPFLQRILRARLQPDVLIKRGWRSGLRAIRLLSSLPDDVRGLINSMRRGGVQIKIDVGRLDHFGHQIDRAVSRLTIGIVTAALIIGTSIISATSNTPTVMGLPPLGFIGFLASAVSGVWLLISIWRGRKD